jgi:hypothetical protein
MSGTVMEATSHQLQRGFLRPDQHQDHLPHRLTRGSSVSGPTIYVARTGSGKRSLSTLHMNSGRVTFQRSHVSFTRCFLM